MTATCTVCIGGGRRCGKPAVFVDAATGFAECATCAAHPAAMARAPKRGTCGSYVVGERVVVRRYGKEYDAVVTHVGARGAAHATFAYGNGTRRTVRVDCTTRRA